MSALIDITGQRLGNLYVHRISDRRQGTRPLWECFCYCGNENPVYASGNTLRMGHTRSCGCLRAATAIVLSTKHGMNKRGNRSPEYTAWRNMLTRCYNPKCKRYKYYGGRGIGVCAEWYWYFDYFLADMGTKSSPRHSLDRYPDNDGMYEKGNCRWATLSEQARNKRNYTGRLG
jgi:hypothetical protein